MTNAVEPAASGDAGKALENLLTDSSTAQQPVRQSRTSAIDDPRFAGKNPEQIVEMYKNLESHAGRLANNLGQTQQQLTEALAATKRLADIREHGSAPPAERQINGMELITDPNKALNDLLTSREKKLRDETESRINRLEAELARSRFERNHPDAQQLFNDPLVAQFAQGTPLRAALAQRAQQGDAQAADALLTEFKLYKSDVAEPTSKRANADAANVSLESARSSEGSANAGGKIYKRADIRALLQQDPERYYSDAVQNALLRAHREGRVVE